MYTRIEFLHLFVDKVRSPSRRDPDNSDGAVVGQEELLHCFYVPIALSPEARILLKRRIMRHRL